MSRNGAVLYYTCCYPVAAIILHSTCLDSRKRVVCDAPTRQTEEALSDATATWTAGWARYRRPAGQNRCTAGVSRHSTFRKAAAPPLPHTPPPATAS